MSDEDSAFSRVLGLDEEYHSLFEDLFGDKGKIHNEIFIEKLAGQAKWIFSAP